MTRFLLSLFLLLVGLLVYGRIGRTAPIRPAPAPAPAAAAPVSAPVRTTSNSAAAVLVPPSGESTSSMDLLARLEGRRQLIRAAATTYFDSLFIETDSVVRRWSDQLGMRFNVAIPPTDSGSIDQSLRDVVTRALAAWEAGGAGVRFTLSSDTAGANIVVYSTSYLGRDRAGQTDIQWTRDGAIHSAVITLARKDSDERPLPPSILLAVAVHEFGHALGLSHSPSTADVMYHATRTSTPSRRDHATLGLLYQLPLGTIREGNP